MMQARSSTHADTRLPAFLAPPELNDPAQAVRARIQYQVVLTLGTVNFLGSLLYIVVLPGQWLRWLAIALVFVALSIAAIQLLRRGRVVITGWLVTGVVWAMLTAAAWTAGGVTAPSVLAQVTVTAMAGMLLGWRAGLATGAACIGIVFAMAYAGEAGWLPPPSVQHTPMTYAFVVANYVVVLALLVAISLRALEAAHAEALSEAAERRRAEDELRRLNADLDARVQERTRQLEDTLASLESFSYSIAHDLRAPLRGINGCAGILEEDYGAGLDDEGRRLCARMRENTVQMSALIDDLLSFSRLRSAGLRPETIDMDELAAAAYEHVAAPSDRELVVFSVGPLPRAEGDPAMVRQVFENLLANALKFTRDVPEPRISVSAATGEHGAVNYTVRDNGVGFEPEYAGKLFLLFERLHGSEYEGTGVGLAIVKRIVEAHGGQIAAASEPGKGAAFTFGLSAPPAAGALPGPN